MADLLAQASAWLDDQREKFLSRSVIYTRGSDSVEVMATIGRTVFDVDRGQGAALRIEARDYLIRAVHLNFGAGPVEPRRGDQIHELQDGVIYIYEVMGLGDSGAGAGGESPWRWSDSYRRTMRIHTKQVDKEMP